MKKVALIKNKGLAYCEDAPFHPSINYPEYVFNKLSSHNTVYDSIRNLFALLDMDGEHFNTPEWNPFKDIIAPGNTVLIKPNFVKHGNPGVDFNSLVTHGSIIRAVVDYVYLGLRGSGKIIIGDAPIQSADFPQIIERSGIDRIVLFYAEQKNFEIEVMDFRLETGVRNAQGIIERNKQAGDRYGYAEIDLAQDSMLHEIDENFERFRVTDYDPKKMVHYHQRDKHSYLIAGSMLMADVIVNVPKLKTHRKAGMTCSLKNIIGINVTKDSLPHHRYGAKQEGGDEYLHKSLRKKIITRVYEKLERTPKAYFKSICTLIHRIIRCTEFIVPYKDAYFEGSWYGNDTLPRTIADLNRILLYANKTGAMTDTVQRKLFILVDAIIAGEHEGPLYPTSKPCGALVAGYDPVAVDLVCSRIMGFDYEKIPQFKYVMADHKYPVSRATVHNIELRSMESVQGNNFNSLFSEQFMPAKGWKGHIELAAANDQTKC